MHPRSHAARRAVRRPPLSVTPLSSAVVPRTRRVLQDEVEYVEGLEESDEEDMEDLAANYNFGDNLAQEFGAAHEGGVRSAGSDEEEGSESSADDELDEREVELEMEEEREPVRLAGR
jgi:hypothetical protein